MIRYCPCGQVVTIGLDWNGRAYRVTFNDDAGNEFDECPGCGENVMVWLEWLGDTDTLVLREDALLVEPPGHSATQTLSDLSIAALGQVAKDEGLDDLDQAVEHLVRGAQVRDPGDYPHLERDQVVLVEGYPFRIVRINSSSLVIRPELPAGQVRYRQAIRKITRR